MPYSRSRTLGDHAERALGAHEQPGEVVAGGRLSCTSAGFHDAAVGHDHGQPQHVFPHRPVAHRVGSRRAGRGHSAERGVGPRVDGEEQSRVAQVLVELLAPNPRLDPAIEVLGVHLENLVHSRDVDGNAAVQRLDVPFERRSGAEGNHGTSVARAHVHDAGHLFGTLRKDDDVGRRGPMVGLVVAMLFPHRCRGGHPVGKELAQLVDNRGYRFCGNAHRWLRRWRE